MLSYYGVFVERLHTATPDSWSDDMTAASQKAAQTMNTVLSVFFSPGWFLHALIDPVRRRRGFLSP